MRICAFPECERPHESKGYCKGHSTQLRKTGDVWAFGDKARKSAAQRAAMMRLSPEERKARAARMIAARNTENLSAAMRRKHAEGFGQRERDASCLGCAQDFRAKTIWQRYCSKRCAEMTARLARFGLTQQSWQDMLTAQGNACALCGEAPKGWGTDAHRRLHIDHCHITGKTRALLCGECNTAIGRFGDDPQRLRAAADYLERYAAP